MSASSIERTIQGSYRIFDAIDQNPELTEALSNFGYSAAVFGLGRQALARTEAARNAAHICHGNQLDATKQLNSLRAEIASSYAEHTRLAKIIFAEQLAALEILGLRVGQRATPALTSSGSRRSKALASLLDTTRIFYTNLLSHPDLLAAMATVGCGEPQAIAALAKVEDLRKTSSAKEMAMAMAKGAVQRQKDARGELERWLRRFRGIAAIALRSQPEMLMAMGLKA